MPPPTTQTFWTPGRNALLLSAVAGLAVVVTLGDPGITIDEPLDVRPGRTYVATLWAKGWHFFDRDVVAQVFADNAEHPPLGRWLLGIASTLGEPFAPLLGGDDPFNVHAGRLAPAACFALLVGLVALTAGRRFGRAAGVGAGASLLLMPRVFAHAHFGALDTFVALFWTAALLAAARAAEARRPLVWLPAAGLVWGLALLTKIHGWLLPPLVLGWALTRLPWKQAVVGGAGWLVVGPAALAEASKNEIRLTARQKLEGAAGAGTAADEVIVEALIRTRAGDSAARPAFGSLSLRFAICQPEGAGWHFLKLVRQICDELSLAVVYGERTYAPEVFWAFRLRANEQIRNQEETWQQLFEQDTERLTIGVDDMWSHFLKKHPAMVEAEPEAESAERTLPPAKIAAESCTDIDTEETMPSSLAKAVSALRKTET